MCKVHGKRYAYKFDFNGKYSSWLISAVLDQPRLYCRYHTSSSTSEWNTINRLFLIPNEISPFWSSCMECPISIIYSFDLPGIQSTLSSAVINSLPGNNGFLQSSVFLSFRSRNNCTISLSPIQNKWDWITEVNRRNYRELSIRIRQVLISLVLFLSSSHHHSHLSPSIVSSSHNPLPIFFLSLHYPNNQMDHCRISFV